MSRLIALPLLALSLLVAALAIPATAEACSCAGPRDYKDVGPYWGKIIKRADGAVVGVVKSVTHDGGGNPLEDDTVHVIRVRNNYKNPALAPKASTIEVRSAANGAACGIEARVGDRIGLVLYREDGELRSNLCVTTKPGWIKRGAEYLESGDRRAAAAGPGKGCAPKRVA